MSLRKTVLIRTQAFAADQRVVPKHRLRFCCGHTVPPCFPVGGPTTRDQGPLDGPSTRHSVPRTKRASRTHAGPYVAPQNRLVRVPQPSPPTNELCQNTDYGFAADIRSRLLAVVRQGVGPRTRDQGRTRDKWTDQAPST